MSRPGFRDLAEIMGRTYDAATIDIDHFTNHPLICDRLPQLSAAFDLAPSGGHALEFGVFTGTSLRSLSVPRPDQTFTGFDSFEGLPEAWVINNEVTYDRGHFGLQKLPLMPPNVTLVKGFFEDSLTGWLAANPGPVSFAHIDCDIYSGAKYVLTALTERLVEGAVIVFDELGNWSEDRHYSNWQDGEWRAFGEWLADSGFRFRILSRDARFSSAVQVFRDPPICGPADLLTHAEALLAARAVGPAMALLDAALHDKDVFLPAAILALQRRANSQPDRVLARAEALLAPGLSPVETADLQAIRARALLRLERVQEADRAARLSLKHRDNDPPTLALGGLTAKRLTDYNRARVLYDRAHRLGGNPVHRAASEDCARLAEIRPEYRGMKFSGLMIQHLIDNSTFETALDIGSGSGEQTRALRDAGKTVTELDYGESVYFRGREGGDGELLLGDFVTLPIDRRFDCVIASHVLEHQPNVGLFLRKAHEVLHEGGTLAISVPPAKPQIVGGHLTIWNAGLLLYNLVLAGFDCRQAWVRRYGYNISVVIRKRSITPQGLEFDNGDVDRIAEFLPEGLGEGFDGEITSLG